MEFQVHLGAHRARDHPVHAVELHALNPLAVNTEQDVPNPHFPALVGRRAGNDLADVDPEVKNGVQIATIKSLPSVPFHDLPSNRESSMWVRLYTTRL